MHVGIDLEVFELLVAEFNLKSVSTAKLFPDLENYCTQYKGRPPKPVPTKKKSDETGGRKKKKKKAEAKMESVSTGWAENEGMQAVQLLTYQMMANVSDTTVEDGGIELGPMWSLVEVNKDSWQEGVHDFGGILLGYQTSSVSSGTDLLLIVVVSNLFPSVHLFKYDDPEIGCEFDDVS